MAFWISRGKPSEAELSLTSFNRGGTSIEIGGADEFFTGLLEKVEALETFELKQAGFWPLRLSMSPAPKPLTPSHASCTASFASASDPSIL
jgi:hypothetical protein